MLVWMERTAKGSAVIEGGRIQGGERKQVERETGTRWDKEDVVTR
jgi:hypothetical protein